MFVRLFGGVVLCVVNVLLCRIMLLSGVSLCMWLMKCRIEFVLYSV